MGYSLEISKIKNNKEVYIDECGKLYGYVVDVTELESWKWLNKNKGVDIVCWDYGIKPKIILKPKEFREFIKLYDEDFNKQYHTGKGFVEERKCMQDLINSDDDILLEWF